jgi:hypothetical protein
VQQRDQLHTQKVSSAAATFSYHLQVHSDRPADWSASPESHRVPSATGKCNVAKKNVRPARNVETFFIDTRS